MSEGTAEREAILQRYHQRISAGQRTRLTASEQATLIRTFIRDLRQLDQPEAIQARCREELALLEEGYPKQTVASRMLAPYRTAIRTAIDDGTLPLTDATSHIVKYTKRDTGEDMESREHWALTALKYDRQTYAELRSQSIATNNARQDSLQPVKVDSYLETVTAMLTEDEPHVLTAGIIAGAGRRQSEAALRGTFAPTEHPYVLTFTGQQKKRDTAPSFHIVTIVPAKLILDAVERLRAHGTIQGMKDITSINDTRMRAFNVQVNRVIRKRFEEPGIIPRVKGTRAVSSHSLRGVYAAVAVYLWCPEEQHEARFLQHYLGHVLDGQHAPNSEATSHYFRYRLLDGDGEPLHAKGILIPTFGPPPHTNASETPQAPIAVRRPTLPLADLERLQTFTDQIGVEGSPAQRLRALLDWAESRQVDDQAVPAAPAQDTPNNVHFPAPAEMTAEATQRLADKPDGENVPTAALDVLPVVADQAKTLAFLTEEIATLREQIATLRQQLTSAEQAQQQARDFRAERSILQAKIDSLASENRTLQRRLDRFDSLRNALWGESTPTPAHDEQEAPAAPQTAPAAPRPAQAHPPASDMTRTPAEPAERPTAPTRGQARIDRIWQLIQDWNNARDRPTNQKIALTVSVLERRFGVFRKTAQTWMEAHQQEVEQHNQAHGITATAHNRSVPDLVWDTLKDQAQAR